MVPRGSSTHLVVNNAQGTREQSSTGTRILTLLEEHIDVISEIKIMRVAVDRVMPKLNRRCNINDCVALLNVLSRATGRIGHLIRLQKFIYGDQNSVSALLYAALEEVAEEYDFVK